MTTALVLSGGGSLGAVQAGMLRALADAGVVPDLLVGTSVGALNAAYVAGRPWLAGPRELVDVWAQVGRGDVFPTSPATLLRAVAGRSDHLVSDHRLRALIARHLTYERLEQAPIPVAVVATEVMTGMEVVLRQGDAVDAVMGSAGLPGVFAPTALDGHLLIDGGLVDNTPISVAVDLGADSVIVLPTGYACALPAPPRSALALALHAVTLAIQRRLIDDVIALQGSLDLRVVPPLCPLAVSPIDFGRGRELADRAYRSTSRWLHEPRKADQSSDLRLHVHDAIPTTA
jgi:NTE family protein